MNPMKQHPPHHIYRPALYKHLGDRADEAFATESPAGGDNSHSRCQVSNLISVTIIRYGQVSNLIK